MRKVTSFPGRPPPTALAIRGNGGPEALPLQERSRQKTATSAGERDRAGRPEGGH